MTNTDKTPVGEDNLLERETVEFGAIKFTRLRTTPENVLGQLHNKYFLAQDLFRDMGDVRIWRPFILECGIPADLERRRNMWMPDYYAAVEQKLGVEPSLGSSDPRASFGAFLAEFGFYDGQYRLKQKDGDPDGAMQDAVTIGRLFELHRWRDEGHDAKAVFGRSFSGKTTDAAQKGRSEKGKERAQHVIEFAQRMLNGGYGRFASGRINQRKLARKFLELVKPRIKEDRVRQIIRAAIHDEKLV